MLLIEVRDNIKKYNMTESSKDKNYRCIYAYEFSDNSVYVGLTFCLRERHLNRFYKNRRKDTVVEYIEKTELIPKLIQLTEYVPLKIAEILEGGYVEKYRDNGWNILNKVKTGAIGGNEVKWTKKACKVEALKYKTKAEFREKSESCYSTVKRKKWVGDVCSHMIELKKPNGYLNIENSIELAKKYKTRHDFAKNEPGAYKMLMNNKLLNEACVHMKKPNREYNCENHKPDGYWNDYEKCKKIAIKCKHRYEYKIKYRGAYNASRKHGWLDEYFPKEK